MNELFYSYPTTIEKYGIYDVIYNCDKELILLKCGEKLNKEIILVDFDVELSTYECPYKKTTIYKFSNIPNVDYIKIKIDTDVYNLEVKKYPIYENKIVFSTEVKDEDNYILQWIDFHKNLGVDKFIIYDNSEENNLSNLLKDYILNDIVFLIKWPYPLFTKNGRTGQTTQQNHTIYSFKKIKYIGFFDIDEYVNLSEKVTIPYFIEKYISEEKIDINNISGFQFLCKLFFNPHNKPEDNINFLNIFNCGDIIKNECQKNLIIPKNVETFAVHIVTSGKPILTIKPEKAYFNHYFFLNKTNRGRTTTNLIDNTILKHISK